MDILAKRIRTISPSQTLAISAKAKAMKAAGENVVSFGAGEPDFNTPAPILEAAKKALDRGGTKYTPAEGLMDLRRAVCEKFRRDNGLGYEPSQVVVSSGAKHSIFNVCFALVDEGDEVVIPSPHWLTYPEAVKACGGVPVFVKGAREAGFKITPQQLKDAVTPRTKLFIFNSPCNPTGAVYSEEEIRALAKVCEEAGIWTLSDEIYEKLVYGSVSSFSFAACSPWTKEHTVTVNGVSKTYAMTGFRIGYLAGPEEIARAVGSFQSHTTGNPNSVAQYAAIAALSLPKEESEEMIARFAERRRVMLGRLSEMRGASCIVPDGTFYTMLDVSGAYGKRCGGREIDGSVSFAEALLDRAKVAVIPGKAFGEDDCIRLSFTLPPEEILEGLGRIDAFLRGLAK